jgi:hypothetical protein
MLNKTGGHEETPLNLGIGASLTYEGHCRDRRRADCLDDDYNMGFLL